MPKSWNHKLQIILLRVKKLFWNHMVVQLKKFRHHSLRMCSTGKWNRSVHFTHGLVCVKATEVQVFLCTSLPSLALPLTMQYGTPILRHRAGKNTTSYKWNKLNQLCIDIHRHIQPSDKTTRTKAENSENSYRIAPVSGCCSGLKSSYFWSSVWIQVKKFKTSLQTTTTRFMTRRPYPAENLTSMGSTSWAITTSCAFLLSTSVVTVFTPEKKQVLTHV